MAHKRGYLPKRLLIGLLKFSENRLNKATKKIEKFDDKKFVKNVGRATKEAVTNPKGTWNFCLEKMMFDEKIKKK